MSEGTDFQNRAEPGIISEEKVYGMKKKNRGFSLIELIIAIAILIILTGLLAPQFMKYIEKSRKAACLHAMDVIAEEYMAEITNMGKAPDEKSAVDLLSELIVEHGGDQKWSETQEDTSIFYRFSGVCKGKGNYKCRFVNDLHAITLECSKHGGWTMDIVTLSHLLNEMNLESYNIVSGGKTYRTLADYFGNDASKTLDSEASTKKTDEVYGKYGSLANIVELELKKQGVNVSAKSWIMRKDGSGYELYLTDRKITKDDDRKEVTCTKYDTNKKEIVTGTVTVMMKEGKNGEFPAVNYKTFKMN